MYFFTIIYSKEQLAPETGAVTCLQGHVKACVCFSLIGKKSVKRPHFFITADMKVKQKMQLKICLFNAPI